MIATRVLLTMLVLSAISHAQESLPAAPSTAFSAFQPQLLRNVELPASPLVSRLAIEKGRKQRVMSKEFIAWTVADGVTIAADAVTTVHCLNFPNCLEKNPIFGAHPSPQRVAVTEGAFFAADTVLSYWLKKKGKSWWWVPVAVNTAQGGIAAGLNLRHW